MKIMALSITARCWLVLDEIASAVDALDERAAEEMATRIVAARSVFCTAQGRSGLVLRAMAIRLLHIGIDVKVAGEASTPAIGSRDLLIAVSASGRTPTTLEHLAASRRVGAATALITASEDARDADLVLVVPVRTRLTTVQHAGSLFEQVVLIAGDAIAWAVQSRLGITDDALKARHANLQ